MTWSMRRTLRAIDDGRVGVSGLAMVWAKPWWVSARQLELACAHGYAMVGVRKVDLRLCPVRLTDHGRWALEGRS